MQSLNEVKVQFALGTYKKWYIHLWQVSGFSDPPGLQTTLHDTLPYCEVWSGGMYLAYGTEAQMVNMKHQVQHMLNPLYEKGFDFHKQDAPKKYFEIRMRIEVEDSEDGIKKVWM